MLGDILCKSCKKECVFNKLKEQAEQQGDNCNHGVSDFFDMNLEVETWISSSQ